MKKNVLIKGILLSLLITVISISNVYAYDYFPDDIYEGDYSLEEMLKNYSVITFGKKEVDSQFQQWTGISKGDVKLFHINSQFLINGRLTNNNPDIRVDFRNGKNSLKSYVKSTDRNLYCGNGSLDSCNNDSTLYSENSFNYNDKSTVVGNYMNFDRLYEKIVDSQSKIPKGKTIPAYSYQYDEITSHFINLNLEAEDYSDGIGAFYLDSGYFAENHELNNISISGFDQVKNNLTIFTIDAPGTVTLPALGLYMSTQDVLHSILTNDYYGMERPNSDYANFFVPELYSGNIIWNIPNATEVKLRSYSFVGHVIAPNADIISPENQFAGTLIANSISFEGNSEAHFYPLQYDNLPYVSSLDYYKADSEIDENKGSFSFSEGINPENLQEGMVVTFKVNAKLGYEVSDIKILDAEGNVIQFRKISVDEYEFTMPATNVTINPEFKKKEIKDILTNPKTGFQATVVIITIISLGLGTYLYKKKESKKI